MDIIQRHGESWQRQPDGSWLRFDMTSGMWLPSAVPPPPPPPPPPAGADPYFALPKPSRHTLGLPDLRAFAGRLDRRVAVISLVLVIGLFGAGGAALLGGDEPPSDAVAQALDNDARKKTSKSAKKHARKPASRKGQRNASKPASAKPAGAAAQKARFIRQADAICADLLAEVQAMAPPADLASLVAVLEKARVLNEEATKRGLALRVPKDARAGWDRFVGHPEDGHHYQRMIDVARAGDALELQRLLTQMEKQAARDVAWAARYGMRICSRVTLPQA